MPQPPRLEILDPTAALPGGEVWLHGDAFFPRGPIPEVSISGVAAPVVIAANRFLMARVPEGALSGSVEVVADGMPTDPSYSPISLEIGVLIAENLHPVCNPALDADGNVVVTLSGTRGQKTPVSLFKLDANYALKAWSSAIINPSGLALDRTGTLFASSRHDGAVYRLAPNGAATLYAEGLGVATGIAFDSAGDLYVGDRSGTIFKIDNQRSTFVFATLEPSIAAYHLAFGPDRHLYVTGPSTSSHDTIWRISPMGVVEPFFRGLGRPQGMAFDAAGSLLVAASHRGRRGVIRIAPKGQAECVVSANNLVGLAFASGPSGPARRRGGREGSSLILATHNALFHLAWPIPGWPLIPAPDRC